MGKKKRIRKILDALKGIIGDDESAKKLKKKNAFENFIEKLESRRSDVIERLERAGSDDKDLKEALEEELLLIEKSIKRGQRLLKEM